MESSGDGAQVVLGWQERALQTRHKAWRMLRKMVPGFWVPAGVTQFPDRELAEGEQPAYRLSMSAVQPVRGPAETADGTPFGRLLKEWRNRRGLSQLDLALAVRTTQRHLSFIESGRAVPSRDMILRISETMDISLRQQNALLLAAGFAPVWHERDLTSPDLAMINTALDYMLGQHEPYSAFVVDRRWNLLRANQGAIRLTEFLLGPAPVKPPAEPVNLAIALMSSEG